MSEYINTIVAECPNCGDTYPGHVRGEPAAGVHSWGCPACGYATDPTNLDDYRKVEPSLEDRE